MFQLITVVAAVLVGLAMGADPPGCDMNTPTGQGRCLTNFAGLWHAVKRASEDWPNYARIAVHEDSSFDWVADNGMNFRDMHLAEKKTFRLPDNEATWESIYTLKGPRALIRVGRIYDLSAPLQKEFNATEMKSTAKFFVSKDGKQLTEFLFGHSGKQKTVYERVADDDKGGKDL